MAGDPNAPLVMWLQGGPGSSGLIGLFFEMGPYALTKHEVRAFEEEYGHFVYLGLD
jgi:carboxypeptidase C (cathepsin A)